MRMTSILSNMKHSLVWRMTALVLCSTILVWAVFSGVLVWQTERMTHDLLMRQHIQFVDMLWNNLGDKDDLQTERNHPLGDESGMEFAVYDAKNGLLLNASSTPALPRQPHAVNAHQDDRESTPQHLDADAETVATKLPHDEILNGSNWLVSSRADDDIELVVASPDSNASELSHELAEHIGALALLGLLALIPVLYWALRRGLKPIQAFTEDVATRAADNLAPIHTLVPTELNPLKDRLNSLFSHMAHTISREQRFTADAAHELRTPLAATRLQLELAQSSQRPETREKALIRATSGIDRATHVVSQLLQLARLEHGETIGHQAIDWVALSTEALLEAGLPVDDIHLRIEGLPRLLGHPLLWALVLRNLIDNAQRYGGEGTEVFVLISDHAFTVYDNGRGMPTAQFARLGERFYRPVGQAASGAGLGWSIIKRIALLHHTDVQPFAVKPHGFGIKFTFESKN
ncbi:Sensor protein QseC [Ephemeroptericola cinctiostellae]|uniref:histidine kinase n=1 Tax=Ephemeroptericola cinctiostellae TaxID=2268024 RepID=A0A345D8G3_9BURK|nr:ATP-binding protein [Ephemeroptericola cinctiostellae]AXF84651.1 Sensor protein QseC [Ephemeroptericola cinctiostellae]